LKRIEIAAREFARSADVLEIPRKTPCDERYYRAEIVRKTSRAIRGGRAPPAAAAAAT
jgi:hypothetical protein